MTARTAEGLRAGLPDIVEATWKSSTTVQTCTVHLIRTAMQLLALRTRDFLNSSNRGASHQDIERDLHDESSSSNRFWRA